MSAFHGPGRLVLTDCASYLGRLPVDGFRDEKDKSLYLAPALDPCLTEALKGTKIGLYGASARLKYGLARNGDG